MGYIKLKSLISEQFLKELVVSRPSLPVTSDPAVDRPSLPVTSDPAVENANEILKKYVAGASKVVAPKDLGTDALKSLYERIISVQRQRAEMDPYRRADTERAIAEIDAAYKVLKRNAENREKAEYEKNYAETGPKARTPSQGFKKFETADLDELLDPPFNPEEERYKEVLVKRYKLLQDTIREFGMRIPRDEEFEKFFVKLVIHFLKLSVKRSGALTFRLTPENLARLPDKDFKESLVDAVKKVSGSYNAALKEFQRRKELLKVAAQRAGLPSFASEDEELKLKLVSSLMGLGWTGNNAPPMQDEEMTAKLVDIINSLRKRGQLPKTVEKRKQISDEEKKAWEKILYDEINLVKDTESRKGFRSRTADIMDALAIEMNVPSKNFKNANPHEKRDMMNKAFDILIKRGKNMESDTEWSKGMLSFSNAIRNDPKWLEKLKNVTNVDDPNRTSFLKVKAKDGSVQTVEIVPIDSWKFKPEGDSQEEILKALEKNVEFAKKVSTSWWNVLKPYEDFIIQMADRLAAIDVKKDKEFTDKLVHTLETVYKFTLEKFQKERPIDQKQAIQRAIIYLKNNKIVTKQSADGEFKRLTGMAATTRSRAIDDIEKLVKSDKSNARDIIRIANTANTEMAEAIRQFQQRNPKNKNANEQYIRQVINHFLINPTKLKGIDVPGKDIIEKWFDEQLPQYVKIPFP